MHQETHTGNDKIISDGAEADVNKFERLLRTSDSLGLPARPATAEDLAAEWAAGLADAARTDPLDGAAALTVERQTQLSNSERRVLLEFAMSWSMGRVQLPDVGVPVPRVTRQMTARQQEAAVMPFAEALVRAWYTTTGISISGDPPPTIPRRLLAEFNLVLTYAMSRILRRHVAL